MKTEPDWPNSHGAQTMCLDDRLAIEPTSGQSTDPMSPHEAFRPLLPFERRPGNRRLPTASAFFMFLFGVGCGGTWMLILTWLF